MKCLANASGNMLYRATRTNFNAYYVRYAIQWFQERSVKDIDAYTYVHGINSYGIQILLHIIHVKRMDCY